MNIKPIVADPIFIRDNQYNEKYVVITEDAYWYEFKMLLEDCGEDMVMFFPSGKRCFFCEVGEN